MRRPAGGADRQLGEVLKELSHALKNPLGAINVAAAVVMRRLPGDAATQRQLEIIQRSVEKMNRLIESMVDGAREE